MFSPDKKLQSRSKSPIRLNSRVEQSPSKGSRGRVRQASLEEMQKRRENLCTCFDIYELLFQNNVPQRCMAHNNFVTLYCENEHKLLCVNCVYSNSTHHNHKVVPIKNNFKKIEEDNVIMKKHLKQYIQEIKLFERNTLNARQQTEVSMKSILLQLQDQYQQTLHALTEKYNQIKSSIMGVITKDLTKVQVLIQEVDWLKRTYVQREKGLPTSDQESALLYQHMILSLMLENDNLRQHRIEPFDVNEMKNTTVLQIRRILDCIVNPGNSPSKSRMF